MKANPDYRPNPERAVFVQGEIDQALVDRLTPTILSLQAKSRDPLTVYIDSVGGSIRAAELLSRLLKASNQDFQPPCRVITVVTGRAGSAAADLLASGDYVIAYPHAVVHFHGVRTSYYEPLTVEGAREYAEALKGTNERYALALVEKTKFRFFFRYIALRSSFTEYRAEVGQDVTEVECLIGLMKRRLSRKGNSLLKAVQRRHQRYASVAEAIFNSTAFRRRKPGAAAADIEADMLKVLIRFELKENKRNPDWTFARGGLSQLTNDFLLIQEYIEHLGGQEVEGLCDQWGVFVLSAEQAKEVAALPDEEQRTARRRELLTPTVAPIWLLLAALCRSLQEGENELTARDAYWLGLVDEVAGEPELSSLRNLLESITDAVEAAQQTTPAKRTRKRRSAKGVQTRGS